MEPLTAVGKKRQDARNEVDEIVKQRDDLQIKSKTSKGSEVLLDHNHTPAFTKFLAKRSEKLRNTLANSKSFKIKAGSKQVTLEVTGVSPNARHIYEKLGFKSTGEMLGEEDDIWGGLTKMKLTL